MRAERAQAVVERLDRALRDVADSARAAAEKAYLKSPIEHYGATVPAIRGAVRDVEDASGGLSRTHVLAVVRRLWSTDIHELRMAAVLLLEDSAELLDARDLPLLEKMIRTSFTWAYVDGLAANVVGSLLERHPDLGGDLDRWSTDDCFWIRRSALLALMGPLRRGGGDWARFRRYADRMLDEKEFFIRKAIGWVLRETSKKRPDLVRRYVTARLGRMSGVTFREAVRRLPDADRKSLQGAWASSRAPRRRDASPTG
jgi:3-methyladenine DNA glycosylase AlkD